MRFNFFLVIFTLGFSQSIFAQEFFYKDNDAKIQKLDLSFKIAEDSSLTFEKVNGLKSLVSAEAKLPAEKDRISKRELSKGEQEITGFLMALTGMAFIVSQDAYDIGDQLSLTRMQGVFFFVLPFEYNFIYRKCGNHEELVATSIYPGGEELERLKSPQQIAEICAKNQNPS